MVVRFQGFLRLSRIFSVAGGTGFELPWWLMTHGSLGCVEESYTTRTGSPDAAGDWISLEEIVTLAA